MSDGVTQFKPAMTKAKGSKGGKLVQVKTQEEYDLLVEYLLGNINLKMFEWTNSTKQNFKRKANKFMVFDNHEPGSWPNGAILHVKMHEGVNGIPEGTRIFVPWWEKPHVLSLYHGADGLASHFGRNRLYKAVCNK